MSQTKDRVQPARTTIVGGQPPGNAREAVPIPVGLEELLGMAAATPDFAEALLKDSSAAAAAAGLELTATETAILGAIDGRQLTLMIDEVRGQLPEPDRRAFFEQAAVAIAVLVGGAAAAGVGCGSKKQSRPVGQAGDSPMDPPATQPDAAARAMPREPPETHAPTKGIRPDRTRPKTPEPGPITGSRPRRKPKSMRESMKERSVPARNLSMTPATYGMRNPNKATGPVKP
ncbi:MAG: hypothetical protein ABI333_16015 [bacterium]